MTKKTILREFLTLFPFLAGALLLMQSCKKDDASSPADRVNVTTFAGDPTPGFADLTGTAARFAYPTSVATDASGNIYVADYANHRIRKITAAGIVSTLAGSGARGFVNGTGAVAQFDGPSGVATDASGNVYVADFYNHCIRKITAGGVVTTLAGSGTPGLVNGTGAAAQFRNPNGVATDASGNVYVGDFLNHSIRKITATGVVSTLAGDGIVGFADGAGAAARFANPSGVATDASGNIYVADQHNNRIRKITAAGLVSTLAGNGVEGFADLAGTAAQFYNPDGIATDASGNVYVADMRNHRIRKITAAGVVSTLAGTGAQDFANGTGSQARFNYPSGIAVDASGAIYIADAENNCIRKIK